MNSFKITLICLLCLAYIGNVFPMKHFIGTNGEKIYYDGARQTGDRSIHNDTIQAPACDVHERVKTYHYPSYRNREFRITCIHVIDEANLEDGKVEVLKGGAGYRSLFLNLVVPKDTEMNYFIKVYAIDAPET